MPHAPSPASDVALAWIANPCVSAVPENRGGGRKMLGQSMEGGEAEQPIASDGKDLFKVRASGGAGHGDCSRFLCCHVGVHRTRAPRRVMTSRESGKQCMVL